MLAAVLNDGTNAKNDTFRRQAKTLKALHYQGFTMVAETGFEPVTFGL